MHLSRFKALHQRVIHTDQTYSDQELFQEEKLVKNANDAVLNLVCSRCFPLLNIPVYASRIATQYALGYPKIKRIVNSTLWNR